MNILHPVASKEIPQVCAIYQQYLANNKHNERDFANLAANIVIAKEKEDILLALLSFTTVWFGVT